MTKSQKEKAARARVALEMMKAQGLVQVLEGDGERPAKPYYGKPKKKKDQPREAGGATATEGPAGEHELGRSA
jgi:hypothetical protein